MSLLRARALALTLTSTLALTLMMAVVPSTAFAETAYGLTDDNQLLVFDTAAPGASLGLIPVTGLSPGESLVGIDFRPLDAQLYGVGATGRLYVINPHDGRAVVVGAGPWAPFAGAIFGVDFDPLADRIRVVSDADINAIIDPTTGAVTAQAGLNPGNPTVAGLAYAAHVGLTTLYGIDTGSDQLVIFLPPQNGLIVNQGPLGVNATGAAGFDITADHSGVGLAVLTVAGVPTLYEINLGNGAITPIGAIAGGLPLRGFTLVSRPATLWSVDVNTQRLLRYRSIDPSAPLASIPIAGVQIGEQITALDFRPDTGQLYGLGSTNRIYTLDTVTGQATQVGAGPFVPAPVGASDMDFDPVTGQIRIVTVSGQNIRVNPDTGVAVAVTPIAAAVSGIAYTDNVPGAAVTTLFGYQATGAFTFELVRIGGIDGVPSADGGAVTPVANGPANPIVEPMPGMDLAAADGALFGSPLNGVLSKIDYTTGSAKTLGSFADTGGGVEGLAVELPGRLQLASTAVQVLESGPAAVITVTRVQSVSGVITVDYAMNDVTAAGGVDFTTASGTLIFMDGESSKQIVIPITQDAEDENDELFTVTLSNPFLGATILGSASVNVTIVDDDPIGSLPPTVTITAPTADPAFVATSSVMFSLAGTAADDLGVAEVAWVNDRGGAGVAIGTNQWSVPAILLLPGQNVITVTATDTNGLIAQDTLTVTLDVKTYAFAEGSTGVFFDTDLLLGNHHDVELPIAITYLREGVNPVTKNITLSPHSRTTIRVDDDPDMGATAFSTIVDSSSGLPLAVERTQRWDATGYGAHTEKGSEGAANTWYFAEGSQGFFQTFLLLGNPHDTTNETIIRFLREGAPAVTKVYPIAPRSRLTVYAGDIAELVNQSFGMEVTFSHPGFAERAMYFGARLFEGGHAAAGVTAPATTWFLAEGATGSFFTSFLLLANPGDADAHVTLTYFLDAGDPIVVQKLVPASSRLTINLALEAPAMASAAVATRVVSDVPIIAERAMYWPGTPAEWQEAHDSVGVTAAGLKWALAEGRVGGPSAAQTFILLANPGDMDAAVTIVYYRSNGTTITRPYVVAAGARVNVPVNTDVPELSNEAFSSLITADRPIFVERAMYENSGGVFWASGTNATATPIP